MNMTGKMPSKIHILTRLNSYQIVNSIGNNMKTLSLMLIIFCSLVGFLHWQKVRTPKRYIIMLIALLFVFLAYRVISYEYVIMVAINRIYL